MKWFILLALTIWLGDLVIVLIREIVRTVSQIRSATPADVERFMEDVG